MSNDVVKYAFAAGEISPTLYGRTDLTKYDLAVAEGQNFFVDYRGGLSSRPGFEFTDLVRADSLPTRMFPFSFNTEVANNYLLFFGDNYIRFVQDGAYVLSAAKNISAISQAAPAVVTSAAHGLASGQWVKLSTISGMTELNGRTLLVGATATNTFELLDPLTGDPINSLDYSAYTSGGLASPIYEIASPYAASDLAGLSTYQYRDRVRITSLSFPTYNLIRNDHDDWELQLENFSPDLAGPEITSGSGTAPDPDADPPELEAQVIFSVTQVDENGDESVNGNVYLVTGIVNYTATEGSVTITWTPEPTAVSYNVYRSIVASEATLYEGSELGYVGRTRGTSFTDPNIIPDFTKTPTVKNDPFAPGRITRVAVTAGGSGYAEFGTDVSITDPTGTGFEGQAVIGSDGSVVNVIVKNPGRGYTAPVVSFTVGSGATATASVAPLTGVYPALSCVFQQRQIYAATVEQPITIWGSRYKRFSNFDSSDLVLDNDSFEFDLDSEAINPIRHLLPTRGGLLCFTQANIWLLNGGGQNEPLTPTNALADPQTYSGVTTLRPLTVENDILYREGKGFATRLLSYNEISKSYGGDDKSILASHLFSEDKDITAWCYQESPFKVVWAVRSDGALLAFTVVKTEDVFAWTPGSTRGKFLDVISIREGATDRVYVTTQRLIFGRWTKFIERMDLRTFVNVEDAWCVDAGLSLGAAYPAGEIIISTVNGATTANITGGSFTGKEGYFLRGGNGIFKITAVPFASQAELLVYEMPLNLIPEQEASQTFPIPSGSWTLDQPVSTLSGLWHLEGQEVSILGDGNVFPQQTVVNGQVTLDHAVTRAIVGLPYRCRARSLPLIVPDAGIEGRRKRILGIAVRLDKSRGLKLGRSLDRLRSMRERTNEPMGFPTRLVNGIKYQLLDANWDTNGQTYFVQDDPLPVNVLSLVFDVEVGDDTD